MGFKFNFSIALKSAFINGSLVFLLLFLLSYVFIKSEIKLAGNIIRDQRINIDQAVNIQSEKEKNLQKAKFEVHLEILSNISGRFLYTFNSEGLGTVLRNYMKLSEIIAIKVSDSEGGAFASIWKEKEIKEGENIPEDVLKNDLLVFEKDVEYESEKVGRVFVYVTEEFIKKKMAEARSDFEKRLHLSEKKAGADIKKAVIEQSVLAFVVLITLIFSIFVTLRFSVKKPLDNVLKFAEKMAGGDFTTRIKTDRKDETGVLAQSLNLMADKLSYIMTQVNSGIKTLTDSSKGLESISENMHEGAKRTLKVAGSVSDAVEVITRKTDEAINITGSAVEQSKKASAKINDFGKKADEITQVIGKISNISNQVNLLALNATIEAVRAGEAGRGFVVVADEVKKLAGRTGEASSEIFARLEAIRKSSEEASSEIENIGKIIESISIIVANVAQAAGIENKGKESRGIAHEVQDVRMSSDDTASKSLEIKNKSRELSNLAFELEKIVEQNRF